MENFYSAIRVIDLHEREARVFPRGSLFDSAGRSLLLPETRALSAVDLRDVMDGVELRALGLIGYLPLTSEIVLNLQAKFPVKNLWAMLAVADENYDRILPTLRSYEVTNDLAPHQLLARGFCHYLREILTVGIARGYYEETHQGHYKPKVNFGRTVSRYLAKGDDVNVSSDTFSFSANLYVNGILKSACLHFLQLIPRASNWTLERKAIMESLNALHSVNALEMKGSDAQRTESLPMWVRKSYFGALTVYSVLLGFSRVGFSYRAQGSVMPSFLFSLDRIFESYIRNSFALALKGKSFSVFDGNLTQHQHPLFEKSRKFLIKPDLIFKRNKSVVAIGEAKYKPKIAETDRYQVISHVVAIGAPIGIWISPASGGSSGLEHIGNIATGAKFYHYKLDISGNLVAATAAMVKDITNLFA